MRKNDFVPFLHHHGTKMDLTFAFIARGTWRHIHKWKKTGTFASRSGAVQQLDTASGVVLWRTQGRLRFPPPTKNPFHFCITPLFGPWLGFVRSVAAGLSDV